MANKYSSWDKYMLSFTVPSTIKGRTIKNGRYTKLRELIKIRAYIAKLLNNSSDVKYFMNIELGKKFSNPHIHLQLWVKNPTSSTSAEQILNKTVLKFNLNKNRCYLTVPEKDIAVYDYVVKDYAKDLSDDEIWNLETQKKRMRKQLDKKVRFSSKSRDKFSKKIYRFMYYSYGVVRDMVEKSIDFFIRNFFYFSKKREIKVSSFCFKFSILSYKEQEGVFAFESFVLVLEVFRFAPCLDPPVLCFLYMQAKNLI